MRHRRDEFRLQARRLDLAGHRAHTEVTPGHRKESHQHQPADQQRASRRQPREVSRRIRTDHQQGPRQPGFVHRPHDRSRITRGRRVVGKQRSPLAIGEREADTVTIEQLAKRRDHVMVEKQRA